MCDFFFLIDPDLCNLGYELYNQLYSAQIDKKIKIWRFSTQRW